MSRGLIVIAGMSRGGTNLLWNIVQSHPAVIDSYYELNEILGRKTGIGWIRKALVELDALGRVPVPTLRNWVGERIDRFARLSFEEDRFNREKSPGVYYEASEFADLTICTKLVSAWETDPLRRFLRRNDALKYIPALRRAFPQTKILFLIRNGLAVAEGWGRRGAPIANAAQWYRKYVSRYEAFVEEHPTSSKILRFEDLLENPFRVSHEAFGWLGLDETRLEHLRIAVKPTIRDNTELKNTTRKRKIWITSEDFREHIDSSINQAQIGRLPWRDRTHFLSVNRDILEAYGYI